MSSLELRVPPPVVALVAAGLMWLASSLAAPAQIPFGARVSVAVILVCIGLAFGVTAMVTFRRARTTMSPLSPSTTSCLVTHGVFHITRNPMYVSLVMYLLAWAVYLSSWLALVVLPVFVLYLIRFQIRPEERALESLFGEAYTAYKQRVRRWL
jgi:protein-S-isoprenylcysteine O-methyltransferase Ste14